MQKKTGVKLRFQGQIFHEGDKIKVTCFGLPQFSGIIDTIGSGKEGTVLFVTTAGNGLAGMKLKDIQNIQKEKQRKEN